MLFLVPLLLAIAARNALARDESEPEPPVCATSTFSHPNINTDVEILSITAKPQYDLNADPAGPDLQSANNLNFCQVQVQLTHTGANDKVLIEVWLPLTQDDWNGRFQATGGRGFATGVFGPLLGPAIKNGWAAVSTNGGFDNDQDDLSWALNSDRTINWDLLRNYATRGLAEQVLVGKSITEQYFGRKPHHSYWNGCSQGGRQGYVMAQKYPGLLDGIMANAPAISLTHLAMGNLWPQIVMKESGTWMSKCELDWFREKAVKTCDWLDGVSDGVIEDPHVCDFDPLHTVGQRFECDGKDVRVTNAMADVIRKIEEGPRTLLRTKIWHGLPYGTRMDSLAGVTISDEGTRIPEPFIISVAWINNLLLKDHSNSFNVTKLTSSEYFALWAQSNYEYDWIVNADNPDLSALCASGTKLMTWHGINDNVIPYQNTVEYRKLVELIMGGPHAVDQFYRLFLAPGVEHCGGGVGPVPKDPLATLVEWVEKGEAPETLDAETLNAQGELITKGLCAWPAKAKYMGIGDAKRASSWSCEGGPERPESGLDLETSWDFLAALPGHLREQIAEKDIKARNQRSEQQEKGRTGEILDGLKDRLGGLGMGLRIG